MDCVLALSPLSEIVVLFVCCDRDHLAKTEHKAVIVMISLTSPSQMSGPQLAGAGRDLSPGGEEEGGRRMLC